MTSISQTLRDWTIAGGRSGGGQRPPEGRVRVRTLVISRWLAVVGQVVTLLVVSEGLHFELPMLLAMAAVFCSVALNVRLTLVGGLSGWHSEATAAVYLAYDILQLAALLFLTGGLENPFALLVLVPVTISATILSLGSTVALGLLAFVCVSVLFGMHEPLPWSETDFHLPFVYKLAVWLSLSLGMSFLMFYAWRVAEEARQMSDGLSALQAALSREREVAALGGLAAAAAHELGTPLGTIALVAKELGREVAEDSPLKDDIDLLNSQAERCRDILARLARNPSAGADRSIERLPVAALCAAVAEPYEQDGIALVLDTRGDAEDGENGPMVQRSPELLQGLGNLIENAMEFARSEVRLEVSWSTADIRVAILDDGPGFSAVVLRSIGEPYISTRPQRGRMGLGLFISKTLLERTGATLRFANRPRGRGAMVVITWPRRILESILQPPAQA